MRFEKFRRVIVGVFIPVLVGSCATLNPDKDRYARAWDKVVDSQTWETALVEAGPDHSVSREAFYALPEVNRINKREVDALFLEKYRSLVSRAYFRLIAEALESDRRIAASYREAFHEARKEVNHNNRRIQKTYQDAQKKYEAHQQMLEGLRSWKAFNKNGSDDLDFFLEENLRKSYRMYRTQAEDDKIITFLMNRLADLYHKEENHF